MMAQKQFQAQQRIRKRSSFQTLVRSGVFAKGKYLSLWILEAAQLKETGGTGRPRLGIIITKKVDPRAAKRNLWKRRIREIFRHHQNRLAAGLAVAVQARKTQTVPSYDSLEQDFLSLIEKVNR